MSLDGLSLSAHIAQLNEQLAGGRIDKIFQTDKYTLTLWIRQRQQNFCLLISANPEHPRLLLTETPPENPAVPTPFCMLLRKHAELGHIAHISQHSLDRIAVITIDTLGADSLIVTKTLTAELMGKHSNIIFMQDDVIIDAIKRVGTGTSRLRQVLPRLSYTFPPGHSRLNIFDCPPEDFFAAAAKLPGSLEKAIIAAGIGLGPLTAREIIWRAGLPPGIETCALDAADYQALAQAQTSITAPLAAGQLQPCVAVRPDNSLAAIAAFRPEHLPADCQLHTFATLSSAVAFADTLSRVQQLPEQTLLLKLVNDEISRLARKEGVLQAEEAQAIAADTLRQEADILMANLYSISAGTSQVTLDNLYSTGPEDAKITIALDPLLSPLENAQAAYSRYNKLKRAQISLKGQLEHCRQELSYLDTISTALSHTIQNADIHDIRQELISAGYLKPPAKKRMPLPPSQPLQAVTGDGFSILIGKNNRQNDLVTFKQAQPNDLWFHTKNIPGSHVILRCHSSQPSETAILAAAHLAAYYSKAGHSSQVPVDFAKRRHVRKPAGAKPGFVIYEQQQTLYITPDRQLIDSLLNK